MFSKKVPIEKEFGKLAESYGLDPRAVLALFMSKFVSDLTVSKSSLTRWLEVEFPEIGKNLRVEYLKVDLKESVYSLESRVREALECAAGSANTDRADLVSLDRFIYTLIQMFPSVESDICKDRFSGKRLNLYLKGQMSTEVRNGKPVALGVDLVEFIKDAYITYIESGVKKEITLGMIVDLYRANVLPEIQLA